MKTYTYITQSKILPGDLHTPVSIYLKARDLFPQSALMESSDYQSCENSRSFIGLDPIAQISVNRNIATAVFPDHTEESRLIDADHPLENILDHYLHRFHVTGDGSDYCGLYGYTSFNAVKYFEPVRIKDSQEPKNDAPDLLYILYRYLIVFHDFRHELMLIEMLQEGEDSKLSQIEKAILNRNYSLYDFHAIGETYSTLTDEEHKANIRKGIAHCLRGDVFQVVLSRRFIQRYQGDDFQLYRALRSINPSPYLFYFDFGDFRILGSSPETHCKIISRQAAIDPIAGTTRRTGNPETDQALAAQLLADAKENAEHVMLVDLARNDLSRNCRNVQIEFYKEPQFYSHVIHLVSRVSGEMEQDSSSIQTFIETFPAGTLSGAPKVKAMQLISQYEPHNRGIYGGCIGFIGFNGNLNQAITIRTFVSRNNELWFQAGGGIVAKSNEEQELQEVNNKLGALKRAIIMAEKM